MGGEGGLCVWEEVNLRAWEFITAVVVGAVSDGSEGSGEWGLGGAAVVGGRGGLRLGQMVVP